MQRRNPSSTQVIAAGSLILVGAVSLLLVNRHDGDVEQRGTVKIVQGSSAISPIHSSRSVTGAVTSAAEIANQFDISGDPETTRQSLHGQARDLSWAPGAEAKIKEAFASSGSPRHVTVDCRSTACEIVGELSGLTPSNLKQEVDRITGELINDSLRSNGFIPDESPTYRVVSSDPIKVSFSRLVARSGSQVEQ